MTALITSPATATGEVEPVLTHITRETHPEVFAAYDAMEYQTVYTGGGGSCDICGNTLTEYSRDYDARPPSVRNGTIDPGEKGFTLIRYECRDNCDEE
jgi:hypothetical protein